MVFLCNRVNSSLPDDDESYWYYCFDDSDGGDMGNYVCENDAFFFASKVFCGKTTYIGRGRFSDLSSEFLDFLRSLKYEQ